MRLIPALLPGMPPRLTPQSLVVTVLLLAAPAWADIDIEGVVEVGAEADATSSGESYQQAKLKLRTEKKNDFRAFLRLEGESDEQGVRMEDAYIRRYLKNEKRLDVGLSKKRLGLEYYTDEDRRRTINRTLAYRRLEEFAYVGREMNIRLNKEEAEKGDWDYSASLGYSESNDTHLLGAVRIPYGEGWYLGSSLLLQLDRTDDARQFAWAHILSLQLDAGAHYLETETFVGLDPFNSHFEDFYGDGRNIYFAAGKALYAYRWDLEEGQALQPVAALTWLSHDLKTPRYATFSALAGVNYHFAEDFSLMLNLELVGVNSRLDLDKRTYNDSEATIAAKYFF